MAVTQYIGSRYVPIFADPIEWSDAKSYEPLTIVTHQGNSFTSKQYVPIGIDIANDAFWALTGNYNAQIEQYRRDVSGVVSDMDSLASSIPASDFNSSNTVKSYIDKQMCYATPEMYGAVGDGVTDDTIPIQSCISENANVMFGKNKSYLITDTVSVSEKKHIDFNNATITYDGNSNAFSFSANNSIIENLILVNDSDGISGFSGYAWFSHFNNILISYFANGIYFGDVLPSGTSVNNTFTNIFVRGCTNYGIYYGSAANAKLTDAMWNNIFISASGDVDANPQTGISIGAGAGHKLNNLHIYGNWLNAISVQHWNRLCLSNIEIEHFRRYAIALTSGLGNATLTNLVVQKAVVSDESTIHFINVQKASSASNVFVYVSNGSFINNSEQAASVYVGGGGRLYADNTNLNDYAETVYGQAYYDGLNKSGETKNGTKILEMKRIRLNDNVPTVSFPLVNYAARMFRITVYGGSGSSYWNPFAIPTVLYLSVYNDNGTLRSRVTQSEEGSFSTLSVTPTLTDGVLNIAFNEKHSYAFANVEVM